MKEDEKRKHQRPEGRLLERAMKTPPKVSGRQLAKLAEMSEGRVRQIVSGYKSEAGMVLPVVAPAETLARLGSVLDLSPADFDEVGRTDAADIMRGDITSGITEEGELWLSTMDEHRTALKEWLDAAVESDPPAGPLMLWDMDALLEAVARKYRDELLFRSNLIEVLSHRKSEGGDGHDEDSGRGAAPSQVPGLRPAKQLSKEELGLAAHDETHSIEDEQVDEQP